MKSFDIKAFHASCMCQRLMSISTELNLTNQNEKLEFISSSTAQSYLIHKC
jgi:hypothetical protein